MPLLNRETLFDVLTTVGPPRLNVLRGILTETTTLEKQAQGITSNKQLFKLLQKRKRASIGAAKEFQAAGREDLTAKENEQAGILQEYLDVFDTASTNEVTAAIQAAIQNVISEGDIPKKENIRALLFRKGGAFEDKVVDDGLVAKTIDRLVHEAAPPTQSPEVTTT